MTENTCHCGLPAVGTCPCCDQGVCLQHLQQAADGLMRGALGKGEKDNEKESNDGEER